MVLWIYQRVKQVKDESTPRGHQFSLPKTAATRARTWR